MGRRVDAGPAGTRQRDRLTNSLHLRSPSCSLRHTRQSASKYPNNSRSGWQALRGATPRAAGNPKVQVVAVSAIARRTAAMLNPALTSSRRFRRVRRTASPVQQVPRMVARRRSAGAASRRSAGRGAIAPAALHFGERVIARSTRNASGAVITEKAGQPAVRRPPCANPLCAISATRTGLPDRPVVRCGYGDDSRPCPIPEVAFLGADRSTVYRIPGPMASLPSSGGGGTGNWSVTSWGVAGCGAGSASGGRSWVLSPAWWPSSG